MRSWSTNKEQIWCSMSGRVFRSNLTGVAQERDFYKLKKLTKNDVDLIRRFITGPIVNPDLKKICEDWIVHFKVLFDLKEILDSKFPAGEEADALFDELITNMEEDLHSSIESASIGILNKLINKDISVFGNEEEYFQLCYFLAAQYTRTNKIKSNLIDSFKDIGSGFMDRSVGVVRHVFATTISWGMVSKRDNRELQPYLLVNHSLIQFITSDQPVINIHAVGLDSKEIPESTEFYYPISPELALVISSQKRFGSDVFEISEEQAFEYNCLIVQGAHNQIYAKERSDLEQYVFAS